MILVICPVCRQVLAPFVRTCDHLLPAVDLTLRAAA